MKNAPNKRGGDRIWQGCNWNEQKMIEGWFEHWRVLAPHINKTVHFLQNDAVSYSKKKKEKERAERCRFERHCSSFIFPPNIAAGKKEKGAFIWILPGPLSPGAHRPNTLADHAPARKPGGAEPWQSRPMTDQPAAPHENSKKPRPWLYK